MPDKKKIVIATTNENKVRDFREIFSALNYDVLSINDVSPGLEIEETCVTFEENAIIKAQTLAENLNVQVLADDSGLAVDFLNGAPGVYSARYAGDHDDAANNLKLLKELTSVPVENRTASYVCCIALAIPNEQGTIDIQTVRAEVGGYILEQERGTQGFAYDSLFYHAESEKTFAELTDAERMRVSHRKKAIDELQKILG